jgi:DNA-binding transcriptional ArsR family regulator
VAGELKDKQTACIGEGSAILNHMVKYSDAPSLDAVFGALSDPTRRQILDLLARTECRVTDLAKPFSISLPAISKHLRVLEKAGLIKREREGRVHHLRLRAEPMSAAAEWIERYREFWERQLDALSRYLEQQLENEKEKS